MEKKTMGSFMAALRKANGLTQQQVADKLNVSNKTISKWECDDGYPEISILPAIAELYSVTVDELLRGERKTETSDEESKSKKSEERIKYLTEKAAVKFTNSAVLSIVLGAVSLLLAYTICDIVYDYNILWVGYVIILILCGASVAVGLISFNNLISDLGNEDFVEREAIEAKMKKGTKYVIAVVFLASVTLLGLILDVILDAPSFLFAALPATAIVGGVIAYFVRSFLYKKFKLSEGDELTEEQKAYRKKHIKVTAVILAVIIFVSVASPFVWALFNTWDKSAYCFKDGIGFQYATFKEAEREYYKLKAYVAGERKLYDIVSEEYNEDDETYLLYVEEIYYAFRKTENGYELAYSGVLMSHPEEMHFDSYEETEKFREENTFYNDDFFIGALDKDVVFDDVTLTVAYKSGTDYLNVAFDILPVFVLFGACAFVAVFGVSVLMYYRKKKQSISVKG